MEAISVILRGKVQGVGMRNFARRKARLFNIKGYVENLPDGEVHIHAEGTEKDLQNYLKTLKKSSLAIFFSGGRIEKIEIKNVTVENHNTFLKKQST